MKTYTITQIRKERSSLKRYRIYVNNQDCLSVHEDVLVKFGLHKGMVIQPEEFTSLTQADEFAKIRQVVFRYLSYRPRSSQEVRNYLARKDWDPSLCEQVIEECMQSGYLDDRAFAKAWVEERKSQKGFGKLRLRQELRKKGISQAIIEEVLTHINEEEERQQAIDLAERRYLRIQGEPWPKIERRIGQYLMRQGYSADMVYSILGYLRERKMNEEL